MAPPSFDYDQGSAFIYEGYLYYSPNSSRRVIIPPPSVGNHDPFKARRLEYSAYHQPVWWTESWGWMSFIPLAPTFVSYPFEPFSWMPKIVPVSIPVKGPPNTPQRYQTKYQMAADDAMLWKSKEDMLVNAIRKLRLRHSITANTPPLPSSFGYMKPHNSRAIAKCMVTLARNWFGVWMGYFGFVIQKTLVSEYRQPDPQNPHPYWYHPLLNDNDNGWNLPWLDGITSSPVCNFDKSITRAGVVIPWAEHDQCRPSVEFFAKCNIPLFFPWTAQAEQAIAANHSLEYLRPPRELIQQALTFILSTPNNIPLASLIMKRFCGLATEFVDPESVRLLRLNYSSSDVVTLVTKQFLMKYDLLASFKTKSEADEALREAVKQYHLTQAQNAIEDATLPQQGLLTTEKGQSSVFTDWKPFFRNRARRLLDILKDASPKDMQSFKNRKTHPPRKKTQVYVWEIVTTTGGLKVYLRKRAEKHEYEDLFDSGDPYVYNEVHNEWDLFPDFIWDKSCDAEDGIPPVCPAPSPQYAPYSLHGDDYDQDREFLVDETRLGTSVTTLPISSSVEEEHGAVEADEDISFSTPLLRALEYNYGYTRAISEPHSKSPSLDWRGVGKTLGYTASPPSDDEDVSIKIFVSCLASKSTLPVNMDDLHRRNFVYLETLFDFRNVMRPAQDLFIFHNLSSTADGSSSKWLLAVKSPNALLYVVRYILANKIYNLNTIIYRLVRHGIPFHTLLLCQSSRLSLEVPAVPRYRYSNHVWGQADFDSAILECKARLQGPAGRAALLRGGLIGRIAREYISIDSAFDGPSAKAIHHMSGFAADSEVVDYQYWDDMLTEDDISVICGCYVVFTGLGSQTTILSYFPRPREWSEKNGYGWLEWTSASEDLFQSILLKNKSGRAPLNPTKWRSELRGFGYTRRLLEANEARSMSFVDSVCPIRHPHRL